VDFVAVVLIVVTFQDLSHCCKGNNKRRERERDEVKGVYNNKYKKKKGDRRKAHGTTKLNCNNNQSQSLSAKFFCCCCCICFVFV